MCSRLLDGPKLTLAGIVDAGRLGPSVSESQTCRCKLLLTVALRRSLSFLIHPSLKAFPWPTLALSFPTIPYIVVSAGRSLSMIQTSWRTVGRTYWQIGNFQAIHGLTHSFEDFSLMTSLSGNLFGFSGKVGLFSIDLFEGDHLSRAKSVKSALDGGEVECRECVVAEYRPIGLRHSVQYLGEEIRGHGCKNFCERGCSSSWPKRSNLIRQACTCSGSGRSACTLADKRSFGTSDVVATL